MSDRLPKRKKRREDKEHFVNIKRRLLETPAFRALSAHAKALYPVLKLEWKGPRSNTNGRIVYSIRQAAAYLGCSKATAQKALWDLQAKGFIEVRQIAHPGLEGEARSHEYELTELPMAGREKPRELFLEWSPDNEFPVVKAKAHNPRGKNGFRS